MDGTPSGPALHGRRGELADLDAALERASAGRMVVVLVDGEAGIGKSRLLAEATAHAADLGFEVLSGRAQELEQTRPFGSLLEAFACHRSAADPRRAGIAGMFGIHERAGGGASTVSNDASLLYSVVDAFVDLAEELALERPLAVVLDDLQWADPATLVAIGALSRRLDGFGVAMICGHRPLRTAIALAALITSLDATGAAHVTLGPLAGEAVAELTVDVLGVAPAPTLRAAIDGAGGNPLFVIELLNALRDEQRIRWDGGAADIDSATLPPTLRQTILRRLDSMPAVTLRTLRAACILGSSFSLSELAAVTGEPAIELSVALVDAAGALLLGEHGSELRFRHDLIREAIYDDIPRSARLALHHEAGQRLAEAGVPAIRIAEQFARGAVSGDHTAIDWLVIAARDVASTSPQTAADLLVRAIELMGPHDAMRDRLVVERIEHLMVAGQITDAEAAASALLSRDHDADVEAAARLQLGQALLVSGDPAGGLVELERARRAPLLGDAERAAALCWASTAHMWLDQLDAAAERAAEGYDVSVDAADPLSATHALWMSSLVHALRGELDTGLAVGDHARTVAAGAPDHLGLMYPVDMTRGHILIALDRIDDALEALHDGRRSCEALGVRWSLATYQAYTAAALYASGEWDDALTELDAAADLVRETGETYSLAFVHTLRALVRLHRNELGQAGSAIDAAEGAVRTGPRHYAPGVAHARALLLEAQGSTAAALTTLAAAWHDCIETGFVLAMPDLSPDLTRLGIACDDVGLVDDVVSRLDSIADTTPSFRATALRCRGLATGDVESFTGAVAAYAHVPRPLETASVHLEAGRAWAHRGRGDLARPLFERARTLFEQLDAKRDLARLDSEIRDAGLRRGRRGPRQRPATGWASLTTTEQAIAALVAEGLSNPQIGLRLYVSSRTVQTHVSHIFQKLQITSRAQLASTFALRTNA